MKGIRIIAKVDGFRRAGLAHHGVAEYPLDQFTAAQLDQLRAEPNLVIQDIELDEPKPEVKPTGTGKAQSKQ